jgi:hypothetical protein
MVTEAGPLGDWVLMRVAGDPAGRILVYDRHEWECFLEGVRNGEFDVGPADAVELGRQDSGMVAGRRGAASMLVN